jgi:HlyD family secretion protein
MTDIVHWRTTIRGRIWCVALLTFVSAAASALAQSGPVRRATPGAIRLHGLIEPVRSYTVSAPRLTGTSPTPGLPAGQLIVVRLVGAGTTVKRGDLLVEFDRQAQLKSARDREAEYRDLLEQINRKRGEHRAARAIRDTQFKQAANDLRIAELGVIGNDLVARTAAEKSVQTLEEAKAHFGQLGKTFDLRARAEAADLRMLEIQRDRAANAWKHARENADRMRITAPLDGLVVLKTIWKNGTMAEVQEGEEVRPGLPILDVVDPSAMRVRVNANQADVDGLSRGQTARITLDSYPSRTFPGRLEHLSPIATTSTLSARVRTFVALFSIDGADPHLLPDLAAAIEVTPGSIDVAAQHPTP